MLASGLVVVGIAVGVGAFIAWHMPIEGDLVSPTGKAWIVGSMLLALVGFVAWCLWAESAGADRWADSGRGRGRKSAEPTATCLCHLKIRVSLARERTGSGFGVTRRTKPDTISSSRERQMRSVGGDAVGFVHSAFGAEYLAA